MLCKLLCQKRSKLVISIKYPIFLQIIVDRIKRFSYEILGDHKSKFGEDFASNKQTLNEIYTIRSKGLKNEIAGYITKFIKKEIRQKLEKQARIENSRFDEPDSSEKLNTESAQTTEGETASVDTPEPVVSTSVMEPSTETIIEPLTETDSTTEPADATESTTESPEPSVEKTV